MGSNWLRRGIALGRDPLKAWAGGILIRGTLGLLRFYFRPPRGATEAEARLVLQARLLAQLDSAWATIEAWVATTSSAGVYLNKPATPDVLARLAADLPSEAQVALGYLLGRHDGGCLRHGHAPFGYDLVLFGADEIGRMRDRHRHAGLNMAQERVVPYQNIGPARAVAWNEAWIPFARVETSLLCLDFDPSEGGLPGQVILLDEEQRVVQVLAWHLGAYLSAVAGFLPQSTAE